MSTDHHLVGSWLDLRRLTSFDWQLSHWAVPVTENLSTSLSLSRNLVVEPVLVSPTEASRYRPKPNTSGSLQRSDVPGISLNCQVVVVVVVVGPLGALCNFTAPAPQTG